MSFLLGSFLRMATAFPNMYEVQLVALLRLPCRFDLGLLLRPLSLCPISYIVILRDLGPFRLFYDISYPQAIMGILNKEGPSALFRGWGPVCAAGLLR